MSGLIESPELNLIEVRWICECKKKLLSIIDITNEHNIRKAVNDWTESYNTTHGRRVSDILQIRLMKMNY